jgi:hypothetical protein
MPGNGKQPSFKFGFAVVLMAALQNADPRLLKKIFSPFFISRDVNQVPEQPELVCLYQKIQQLGIAFLQPASNSFPVFRVLHRAQINSPFRNES